MQLLAAGVIGYFSRTGTKRNLDILRERDWRILVSATGAHRTESFPKWALDNGAWTAFQRGTTWEEAPFLRLLYALGKGADWCVLPDVVAGGPASLDLSLRWMRRVLDECQRGMIAVQDGMAIDDVRPFVGARVGLFVGGSTEWKLRTLDGWAALAKECGAWCHVGRVNTVGRIKRCAAAGAHSFDGTSASRFAVTIPRLDHAARQWDLL